MKMDSDITSGELAERLINVRDTLPGKEELFYRFSDVMGYALMFLGKAKPDRIDHVFLETADYIIYHREFRNNHHPTAIHNFVDVDLPLECAGYVLELAEHVLGDTKYLDGVIMRLDSTVRKPK